MIEQLLNHRDSIPYALAIGAIVLAMTLGYMLGDKDPATLCAPYIVEVEQLTEKLSDLNEKLTKCQSKGVGQAAVDCQTVCASQVEKALATHKDIVCDD